MQGAANEARAQERERERERERKINMTAKGLQSTSTARRLAGTPGFTQARHHSRQRVVSTRAAAEISNKFSKVNERKRKQKK